uniref:Cobaltochelatase, CobN subunit n=1 Tax=Cyanothece sp. (strain PCC 7425 / ATCC 29141) TaxID=395961 RepID=B8HL11_CYAP4
MHRLAAIPGGSYPGQDGVIFVEQTPAPLVFATMADTDIQVLARAVAQLPRDFPALRVVNLLQLGQQLSIDTYAEEVLEQAEVIVLRLLGGRSYWSYGLEVVQDLVDRTGAALFVLPGDDRPDPELLSLSNQSLQRSDCLWRYFSEGGVSNVLHALQYLSDTCWGTDYQPLPPQPIPRLGVYPRPRCSSPSTARVGVLFYRAHYLAANTAAIDALCQALEDRQLEPLPIYLQSLQDGAVQAELEQLFSQQPVEMILNTTGFAIARPGGEMDTPLTNLWQRLAVSVLQVICSSGSQSQWETHFQGLLPRDMAMNVALPEVDGRLISRAISFKTVQTRDLALETEVVSYEPVADRIQFVADLTANWVKLRQTPVSERRIALILANYPNRDGRLANGVGLDTPASCIEILQALQQAGYNLGEAPLPVSGDELIHLLTRGITNDPEGRDLRCIYQSVDLETYQAYFANLPAAVQQGISDRYGAPEQEWQDHFQPSKNISPAFPVAGLQLGQVFIGIQPGRGYDRDPSLNYHAPDLEPPHSYLAFYYWIRSKFSAHAVVHLGKHGNLEWLPGKSIALSATCYPEVALGALPHLYPFIVNDPGEGSQAKRRSQAVIIDHLTPPLTRAELYGPLQQLENLIDEYYEAQTLDPDRLIPLRDRILSLIQQENLNYELSSRPQNSDFQAQNSDFQAQNSDFQAQNPDGREKSSDFQEKSSDFQAQNSDGREKSLDFQEKSSDFQEKSLDFQENYSKAQAQNLDGQEKRSNPQAQNLNWSECLSQMDGYLCELKEAQIRDGLHIFGQCPQGRQLRDLLIALARQPGTEHLGITRVLAQEWGLDLDPLTIDPTQPLTQQQQDQLHLHHRSARNAADVIEHLEQQAATLVDKILRGEDLPADLSAPTRKELDWLRDRLLPALAKTDQEITHLLRGLDGDYVPAGPSGAPTRGRLDVLPTGRNFYSVDLRSLPTETAWAVGRTAAEALIERYTQEKGEYPRTLGLSLWGTATMRTGGDDLAEALALMGVQPVWEGISRRVVDFEILPLTLLGRPRVDVTLRISGFFRDAFPNLIELFDRAVNAVANLNEPPEHNPLAAQVQQDRQYWQEQGLELPQSEQRSRYRIFGSKPGAYGAGLQGLIEAQNWVDDRDLARAYLNWSSYAYTGSAISHTAAEAFEKRLAEMQIVLHNQDNREHDLLDSDDYYQFQGGLTAAVRSLRGENPQVYFGDHSQPQNPKIRSLKEEIARVYRSRVINPKWIAGVMRHGYKGAFEMAATVDYLFAYDATTHCSEDYIYQGLTEAYLLDPTVQQFIEQHNPWALRDMAERLLEAHQRGLWRSPLPGTLEKLRSIVLQAEALVEGKTG